MLRSGHRELHLRSGRCLPDRLDLAGRRAVPAEQSLPAAGPNGRVLRSAGQLHDHDPGRVPAAQRVAPGVDKLRAELLPAAGPDGKTTWGKIKANYR